MADPNWMGSKSPSMSTAKDAEPVRAPTMIGFDRVLEFGSPAFFRSPAHHFYREGGGKSRRKYSHLRAKQLYPILSLDANESTDVDE